MRRLRDGKRSYLTLSVVSTEMGNLLRASKLSEYYGI